MKNICFAFLSIFSINLCAQDYFSKILPTTDSPLVKTVEKIDNRYFIPTDFFDMEGVRGGLLIASKDKIEKVKFDNMDLGLSPIVIIDQQIYLCGENPLNQGDTLLFVSKLNYNYSAQEYFKEFRIKGNRTINTSLKYLKSNLYTLNVNYIHPSETIPKNNQIFKLNLSGEEIWNITLDDDKAVTNGYELLISSDSALIVSTNFVNIPAQGARSKLTKISQDGDILWNYEGEEKLDNGAVPTWATELSDSTILQTYYVNRTQDVDFIVNNWFRIPNRFIWLSKDGELIREKLIITEFEDRIVYSGVESGQGDYFYAYGYLESLDPAPGLKYSCHLTKFSNSGDTLWTHNYRHPLHLDNNVIHTIKDVLEEDNGDITVLADIRAPGAKVEVWLFKINSEGCYVNEECEDMSDITSTTSVENHKTVLYPNPASGMVHVECAAKIRHISVMDIAGKLISRYFIDGSNTNIDLGAFEDGVYIFQIVDEGGKVETRKLIKL